MSKTKLNEILIENISKAIHGGMYVKNACQLCGISEHIYYEWLERAKQWDKQEIETIPEKELIYVKFSQSVKKADMELQGEIVSDFKRKVLDSKNPVHHAIFLERRWDEYKQRVDYTVERKIGEQTMAQLVEALNKPVIEGEYRVLLPESTSGNQ